MRRLISQFFYLVVLMSCIYVSCPGQQKPRNVRQEITWLRNSLAQHHVAPKTINDAFSNDLFNKLLEDLDPDMVYFSQADITSLEPFRNLLDDEINGKSTGFLDRLNERYKSGLQRTEKLIKNILESPIDWEKKETYDADSQWALNEQVLAERHRQWLKYQILDRLADLMERDSVLKADFFKRNISDAIAHVHRASISPINRMLKDGNILENAMATAFMEAMAGVFDPHSTFFSTHDFKDFVGSLSTEDYYFGFTLDEDGKGNIVISALAPGGAAWKSGALHVSDVLLSMKFPGEEPVNLAGMNIEDVSDIMDGNDSGIIEMTIRGVDGNEKNITLRKEKMVNEQNVVQSFVLHGDIKTGYIYLPDFYTRWGDENEGGRCANDVAREIIKLKSEGIEGLILDLRFNGGGSLYEARAMAGIFIDEGPLAIVTTRDQKAVTLKDINRGTVYDGPLVIMVNGNSASASEVLAASIQDYNRGLIVGGQTHGKATGQNVFPIEGLAAGASAKDAEKTAGYVKVTTQKLYRVTGKSAQGSGVTPDVVLPDIFMTLNTHEDQYPFALPKDSIAKNTYYKPLKPIDRKELQLRSRERIAKNSTFQELQKTLTWLEEEMRKDSEPQHLVWEEFFREAMMEKSRESVMDLSDESPEKIYEVSNGGAKEQRLTVDEYARDLNERWRKMLTSDIYLQETYQILRDHINTTKKLK
ncbi:MAG: carboxy terminal-processing peptidase [Cyclobacteriaceae bacterium]